MYPQNQITGNSWLPATPAAINTVPAHAALHEFRQCHPADVAHTGSTALSSIFDEFNLLHLPQQLIEHAVKITQGVSQQYFSGLLYAEFAIKKVAQQTLQDCEVEGDSPEQAMRIVLPQLNAICHARYEKLCLSPYSPELAYDYAVLEVAAFLLMSLEANQGQAWIHRIYDL